MSKQLLDYFVVPVQSVYCDSGYVPRHELSEECITKFENQCPGMVLAGVTRSLPIFDVTTIELVENLKAQYIDELDYLRQRVDELEELEERALSMIELKVY